MPLTLRAARDALLADRSLTGTAWCAAYAAAADAWLAGVFTSACGGDTSGLALVAVGGYGRGELAPGSDLDLVLVHDRRRPPKQIAEAIWYPIWDEGVHLDHSVRTVKEIRQAADSDLKVALGLVDARLIAGDTALGEAVRRRVMDLWETRASRWLPEVDAAVRARHRTHGDAAFLLEPELKESRGGLRDLTALGVAARVSPVLNDLLAHPGLEAAAAVLAAVRVELQRSTGKPTSRLLLQEQDVVAAALGLSDADVLMARVSEAARVVAWSSDDGWRRVLSWLAGPRGRSGSADRPIEPGLVLRDNEVSLATDGDPATDPSLALRAAATSAELDRPLARPTLERLRREAAAPAWPWAEPVLRAWLRLLGAGPGAVAAIETLDQIGVWTRLLPEWWAVRNRPQRNAYHRFTVDRHLVEAAVGAAELARGVSRPDLLLAGALVHDIGKGQTLDHTLVGIDVVRQLAPNLGFSTSDSETLVALVRHHLLLPDVATRRDLDDPATISAVAAAVGDPLTLELLAALTEADSLATGPSAWGPWKAGLVAELVRRVRALLAGEESPAGPPELTAAQSALLAEADLAVAAEADGTEAARVTVVAPDRPGLLATVTGVLTLSGAQVRSATSRAAGPRDSAQGAGPLAVLAFDVTPAFDRLPVWDRVRADLEAALDGRLRVAERLVEHERPYTRRRPAAASPPQVVVTTHDDASAVATVVEVRAPDTVGLLYKIASTLAELGLFITWAQVSTLGAEVVDAFYVRSVDGSKLTSDARHEVETTLTAALLA